MPKSKLKFKKIFVKAPKGYQHDTSVPIGRRVQNRSAKLLVPFENKSTQTPKTQKEEVNA